MVSEETTDWGAKWSFHLYVLCWFPSATLCQVTPPQQDLDSPNCCGGDPIEYYWKSSSNVIHALFYPLSAFCVFSLCQEFLKSVLWLWHWGRQVRQILHTHTRSEQTRHPVFRNKQRKEIWESHCSCQDIQEASWFKQKPRLIFIIIFFFTLFNCWVSTSNQNGSFLFPVDQSEVICLPLKFWGADFHLNILSVNGQSFYWQKNVLLFFTHPW